MDPELFETKMTPAQVERAMTDAVFDAITGNYWPPLWPHQKDAEPSYRWHDRQREDR